MLIDKLDWPRPAGIGAGRDAACDGLVRSKFPISDASDPGNGGGVFLSDFFMESLILAQNERWQRGLGMQVERDRRLSIFRERETL